LFDFGKGSWLLDKGKEKGVYFDGSCCDSGVYSRQRGREAVEFVAIAFSLSVAQSNEARSLREFRIIQIKLHHNDRQLHFFAYFCRQNEQIRSNKAEPLKQ
jgi:hypothetical protein